MPLNRHSVLRLILIASAGVLPFSGCDDMCGHDDCRFTEEEWKVVSSLSPLPDPPPDPTNMYDGNPAAIALGQKLFFEKRYSNGLKVASTLGAVGDKGKISCTSCHDPEAGFSDSRSSPNSLSLGVSWTTRNAPALVNTVYYQSHGWDLRQDTLWNQGATTPETGTNSAGDRCEYARMLWTHYRAEYNALFIDTPLSDRLDPMHVNPLPPACRPSSSPDTMPGAWEKMTAADKDLINRVMANQGKAVAAYEAKLISRNAPFDRYVAGEPSAITGQAKRGLKVFITKAACVDCHSGPFFTDQKAHNLGIPQMGANVPAMDPGLHGGIPQLLRNTFNAAGAYSDNRELGMIRLTGLEPQESDRGKFRTQTLRNLSQSAPYMHTGQFASVREVVEYYNEGGGAAGFVGAKDLRMQPLRLTQSDIDDLVTFLETLTGEPIPADLRAAPTLP